MNDSILNSIKTLLGIHIEDQAFDMELIMHINSAIADLSHVGVGPLNGFAIVDSSDKWMDFTTNEKLIGEVRQYIYCKTRLVFDPPGNSFIVDSLNKSKDESQWRAYMIAEEECSQEES